MFSTSTKMARRTAGGAAADFLAGRGLFFAVLRFVAGLFDLAVVVRFFVRVTFWADDFFAMERCMA